MKDKEEEKGRAPGFGGGLLILPFTLCGCIIPPVGIIGVLSGSTESSKFCIRGASSCVKTDWPFKCPINDDDKMIVKYNKIVSIQEGFENLDNCLSE